MRLSQEYDTIIIDGPLTGAPFHPFVLYPGMIAMYCFAAYCYAYTCRYFQREYRSRTAQREEQIERARAEFEAATRDSTR